MPVPGTPRNRTPFGHKIPLSLSRRLICDLLHFSRKVPSIPVERRLRIGSVVTARQACLARPGWTAIFAKAYARVAVDVAALRRAYLVFPTAHLYEHPESVATVAINRPVHGEDGVLFAQMRCPEGQPLERLDAHLKFARSADLTELSSYRMAMRIARLWGPIRRLAWWWGLNLSGRQRAKRFGTFGVSAYGRLGAESLHPLSPLTGLLNYGPLDSAGELNVRIVYDHRVLDGVTVARALHRLEEVLEDEVKEELRQLAARQRQAPAERRSA